MNELRMAKGGVYMFHFDPPYRHAQHYIGYADNFVDRVLLHLLGSGNRE